MLQYSFAYLPLTANHVTAKRELWGTESSDQCACVLQEEEQAAAAVPVPVPAFFAYCWLILHQAPSPLNIHVLQSELSVKATVHPHIDGYCMTWLQLQSHTVLKVSSRTVWKIKACSIPSLCLQPLSHRPKHRRAMGAGGGLYFTRVQGRFFLPCKPGCSPDPPSSGFYAI